MAKKKPSVLGRFIYVKRDLLFLSSKKAITRNYFTKRTMKKMGAVFWPFFVRLEIMAPYGALLGIFWDYDIIVAIDMPSLGYYPALGLYSAGKSSRQKVAVEFTVKAVQNREAFQIFVSCDHTCSLPECLLNNCCCDRHPRQ